MDRFFLLNENWKACRGGQVTIFNKGFIFSKTQILLIQKITKGKGDEFKLASKYPNQPYAKEISITGNIFYELSKKVEFWSKEKHFLCDYKGIDIKIIFFKKNNFVIAQVNQKKVPKWLFQYPELTNNSGYLAHFVLKFNNLIKSYGPS